MFLDFIKNNFKNKKFNIEQIDTYLESINLLSINENNNIIVSDEKKFSYLTNQEPNISSIPIIYADMISGITNRIEKIETENNCFFTNEKNNLYHTEAELRHRNSVLTPHETINLIKSTYDLTLLKNKLEILNSLDKNKDLNEVTINLTTNNAKTSNTISRIRMNERTESVFDLDSTQNSIIEIAKSQGIICDKSNSIILTNFNNDILIHVKRRLSKIIFHLTPNGTLKYGEIPTDTDFISNIFKEHGIKEGEELEIMITKTNPNNQYIKEVYAEEVKKKYKITIKETNAEFDIAIYFNSKNIDYANIIGFIDKNNPKLIHEKIYF